MKKINKNLITGSILFFGIIFSFGLFVDYSLACISDGDCSDGNPCTTDVCHPDNGLWPSWCSHATISGCGATPPPSTPPPSTPPPSSKTITRCSGDDQSYAGLQVEYSDGSTSRHRSVALSYGGGGTMQTMWDPPAGRIRTYDCRRGDSAVTSRDRDCGCGWVTPCDGPSYTACAHGVTASANNYWNSTYGYCGMIPGSCIAPPCTPNNCAADTCIGESCYDCNWVAGTKDCSTICGNGIVEGTEACDDGLNNGICPNNCSITCTNNNCGGVPFCGNGITEGTEACDNGLNNGTCPNDCSITCTRNNCITPTQTPTPGSWQEVIP